ncbi:MAG: class II aldolase/adducin family protein [Christensenellaceae bacterium]|nr:class II aldolase/adducin family protein [Christensenellaceae bacterium]
MQNKRMLDIITFSNLLIKEELVEDGDCVSARLPDGDILITSLKAGEIDSTNKYNVIHVKATDSLDSFKYGELHRSIYKTRSDINAIITNHAKFCVAVSSTEKYIPAVLDDVAQIIGRKAYVASSVNATKILKLLKKCSACLIKNGGVIATGRTVDEAHTGSLVLEKGAKAFVEATILGGAKKIPFLDAVLMRFVYKKKYSKIDQESKMQ